MRACVRRLLRTVGEILIVPGLVLLGFAAYMYWGTTLRESGAQHRFLAEMGRTWARADPGLAVLESPNDLAPGQPFAMIVIPSLGHSREFAVVQGTGPAQLALGPGHLPGTALPGQLGNFVVEGHRVTAGNPFRSLPRLQTGDLIYVETITARYEYRVIGSPEVVAATDRAVLAPVPGDPGATARRRLITLVTSDQPWTGTDRLIVTGVLIATLPRGQVVEG